MVSYKLLEKESGPFYINRNQFKGMMLNAYFYSTGGKQTFLPVLHKPDKGALQ
jgi:hypothetical protein